MANAVWGTRDGNLELFISDEPHHKLTALQVIDFAPEFEWVSLYNASQKEGKYGCLPTNLRIDGALIRVKVMLKDNLPRPLIIHDAGAYSLDTYPPPPLRWMIDSNDNLELVVCDRHWLSEEQKQEYKPELEFLTSLDPDSEEAAGDHSQLRLGKHVLTMLDKRRYYFPSM